MHTALGTNKLSSTMGAIASSGNYIRKGFAALSLALPCAAASLVGSAIGSSLSLITSDRVLRWLLIVVLPVTAFWVYRRRDTGSAASSGDAAFSKGITFTLAIVISLVIGCYDGFFGPGTGTFLILLYSGLVRIPMLTATANAKIVNLASNIAALTVFLVHRQPLIPLGLCAGCFSIAGSLLGSNLAIKKGSRLIRVMLLLVLALLFVRLVWEAITSL
jgi:uncharacterized membrane protein YfcA